MTQDDSDKRTKEELLAENAKLREAIHTAYKDMLGVLSWEYDPNTDYVQDFPRVMKAILDNLDV
jgi:hypothetical protein